MTTMRLKHLVGDVGPELGKDGAYSTFGGFDEPCSLERQSLHRGCRLDVEIRYASGGGLPKRLE